ncbi:3'-5' exonuclease (macronuclear) [Tetrahymena thermophila SB210]|uniref:3'-5' exonuclease n=1 Tax=Tetrahymena thermophila (strain SB210) TaxID=312017 RepID=Q22A73_TETTS|nr:3'-5' exonuclease [Tetrahymena thermophila SB210]EAR82184.1 3'-5' exonuclease [Tetrahymena thermophila SB210]|eukprot:XP_001029847.1 3'-5' exonuclease [Tetrahymena thermophila SB210]
MQYQQYFYNYYENPKEVETFHSTYKKNLNDQQLLEIQNKIQTLFEKQKISLNAKKQLIYQQIVQLQYPYRKKFICSSWVRGFCFFQTKDCIHAHGIDDLNYNKDDDISISAQTMYERIDMKSLTSSLNYIYLYEFCQYYNLPCQKDYSLEQINNDRTIRTTIREYTRTKMFEEFYLMIRRQYPDIFLTEQFLVQEFIRIGVGSDAFGFSIKSIRIASYLMKNMCYIAKFQQPPSLGTYSNFVLLRDKNLDIYEYFKAKVIEVLKEIKKTQKPLIESNIRQLVKQSQLTELEPCFEIYLVKDNMCLFRFFKTWAIHDEEFLKQCIQLFENTIETSDQLLNHIVFDCCSDKSEKIMRKNKLIEEYLSKQYKNQKKKLCRYWLRGLCIFEKQQCQYSHGIEDLVYEAYDEKIDDPDYIDFMSQKPLWKQRSYVSLFQEQEILLQKGLIDKIHSQEDLDNTKELRENIRDIMQKNAMELFMEEIWKYYGRETILTESFIVREFRRVGFFKLGYTLKNQMIVDIVAINKCFVSQTVLPPLVQKTQILYAFPPYEKAIKHYVSKTLKAFIEKKQEIDLEEQNEEQKLRNQQENSAKKDTFIDNYEIDKQFEDEEQIINKVKQQQLEENDEQNQPLFTVNEFKIKKEFYRDPQADIPPLHLIQKHYNKQLEEIINDILDNQDFKDALQQNIPQFNLKALKNCLILDSDTQKIQNAINVLLQKKTQKMIFNFDKFLYNIYLQFRPQIRATIGFTKFKENFKQILTEKYDCEVFNMSCKSLALQKKIFKQSVKQNNQKHQKNNLTAKSDEKQYKEQILQDKYIFKQAQIDLKDRIKIVDTIQSIDEALRILQQQSYLGVDLEGSLSKHGHIELIQISYHDFIQNHSFIYVFDFVEMEKQQEVFILAKKAIKQIMEDKSIIKILQGCQKDALALYHLFSTQIINGLDTQVAHNFIIQLKALSDLKQNNKKKIKDLQYFNCGLNQILQIYNAPNGLNPLKAKFQSIFVDPVQSAHYMKQRPINEEFLIYSSKDVEDLIPVFFNILKSLISNLKTLYDVIDSQTATELILKVSQVTTNYKQK